MKPNQFVSARRVVDMPEWYGGGWDLVTGRRVAGGKYSRSPWAFACMQIRGAELAHLPWQILRDDKPAEDHALVKMLQDFGPESNYTASMKATEIDLLLYGHAFWLHDADILVRLAANTMKVKSSQHGITAFEQTIGGKVVNRFAREEVVYFREFHPDTDLDAGTPVMEVVQHAIDETYEAARYVEAFFKNDATPSLLLTTEQTVAQSQMDKVLAWWNKRFRGVRRSNKVAMADRGLKAQILANSNKDNALVEIRDQGRADICTGFRVPKILVGSMEDATYANAQEARKFMIEDLIIPRSNYFQDVINADLVKHVDPGVTFSFEADQLPILQENATSKWDRLDRAIQRGVISEEFARQQMGWPETAAPAEDPQTEQITQEIDPVLRSWKRKAVKAFKRGERPDVPFQTDEISQPEQVRIHSRLLTAGSIQDITRAFIDD